jgi:hypothetical protein
LTNNVGDQSLNQAVSGTPLQKLGLAAHSKSSTFCCTYIFKQSGESLPNCDHSGQRQHARLARLAEVFLLVSVRDASLAFNNVRPVRSCRDLCVLTDLLFSLGYLQHENNVIHPLCSSQSATVRPENGQYPARGCMQNQVPCAHARLDERPSSAAHCCNRRRASVLAA